MQYHFDHRTPSGDKQIDLSDHLNDVAAANHSDQLCALWSVNIRCWRLEEGQPAGTLFPGQETQGKLVVCDSRIPTRARKKNRKDY